MNFFKFQEKQWKKDLQWISIKKTSAPIILDLKTSWYNKPNKTNSFLWKDKINLCEKQGR